ncbi:Na(+)/H(+) antiporter subunit D [Halomonadaceae bacterium LMG 33818]|uniref:monovalent cation/H+ antiporter subunit D n=1 Tax=Cernens ardua TaxID=3402176 RepID=UPI003EDC06EB
MMYQLVILPILLPLLTACVLLLINAEQPRLPRIITAVSMVLQLAVALSLVVMASSNKLTVYALGNWHAPYGIVLVNDRLSAFMVLITILLGTAALLYASDGQDTKGSNFHAVFQFQLMGICGAFLTGDIFNLFVFFEVLLISSYVLLLHSGGRKRTLAGMHYVVLNVAAASFFLIAIGVLYGTLGTLNMADMALKIQHLTGRQQALVASSGLILITVFLLKAAIFPLHFWLPRAYAAAPGSVAVIFAIMTKVGIYAVLRVNTLIFASHPSLYETLGHAWLWWGGLATIAMGGLGVFSSPDLRLQVSYLTLVSVGTMVAALGIGSPDSLSAVLFYLPHTTFITAGLYLIAEVVGRQRGRAGTRIVKSRRLRQPYILGSLYLIGMLAILGIPPFSGSIAKVMILFTAHGSERLWLWGLVLFSTLLGIISASRAGTTIFWRTGEDASPKGALLNLKTGGAVLALLSSAVLIPLCAYPLQAYTHAIALQLFDANTYTQAIMGHAFSTAQNGGAS